MPMPRRRRPVHLLKPSHGLPPPTTLSLTTTTLPGTTTAMSSCSVAPGSPVFSPSRLLLLNLKQQPQDLPASPLRPVSLRARHRRSEPSPSSPAATSSVLLKRRRPAPLLIVPPPPEEAVVVVHHEMDQVAEQGDGFAAYCKRGRGRKRLEMEDRHVAAVHGGDAALFGVFDGHGGKSAAEFAAANMPRIMAEELALLGRDATEEVEAVRRAYLRTDDEFCRDAAAGAGGGGACSVTALLREGRLVVSNAGDCRAVLSRGGRAEALTDDHRASRQDERERIEGQGGVVLNCRGTWRVQGSLAVSRSIGDAHLKPWVVAEPETTTVVVDADCDLLILASDGLWDKVTNQEAVDAARASSGEQLAAACRRLVEMASSRGSTDDVSVLIIDLQRFL